MMMRAMVMMTVVMMMVVVMIMMKLVITTMVIMVIMVMMVMVVHFVGRAKQLFVTMNPEPVTANVRCDGPAGGDHEHGIVTARP